MKNLLLFLQKYNYWFLFLLLEVCSFILLFQYNRYQGSVYFTSANAVCGYINNLQSQVTSYFSLKEINSKLTEQNIQLNLEVSQLRSQLDALRDSSTISPEMKSVLDTCRTVPASVISMTQDRKNNFLTINKGSSDGIRPEMGVVGGSGLVGVVFETTTHYSLVLPLLNTRSSISCRIRNRGYLGNLKWDGDETRYAMLEDVPRHAYFRKGDYVETSGYSKTFPAGILAGRIVAVYDSEDGMSYQLKVKLSTDFELLRDVQVLQTSNDMELNTLQDRVKKLQEERQ
ncbi:MAG: rod shape-determining protein MreC [Bacteroidales bacterium]|nr:rod shape-determining protein MreC [Candidatus Minthousia equi]MDO4955839.1 rod shape-determining protein MreC [Bacteroidales bacterium]